MFVIILLSLSDTHPLMITKSHAAFLGHPSPPVPYKEAVWVASSILLLTYSLERNKIDDIGAQALAEGLQHCTNLQKLRFVIDLFVCSLSFK